MNLLALVEAADHVCSRYRIRAFGPALAAAGHRLTLRPFADVGDVSAFDAVILQRRLLPSAELVALRKQARRLIFDFDDAVFARDSYSWRGFASLRRALRFARTARLVDEVVAGNDWLADKARIAGAPRTTVIPTCVDPSAYSSAAHRREGSDCRLAWIGSSSTRKGFARSRPIWGEIGRALPGISLRVICDRGVSLEPLRTEHRPWSAATEAAELAACDVGVSWVPNDDWSRGKCGLKVLQYMAAGLPVVANPVGVQAEMVRPGVTGVLVTSAAEWAEAVAALAADPELRRRMGEAGRRRVEAEFSVAAGASRWCDLLSAKTVGTRRAA